MSIPRESLGDTLLCSFAQTLTGICSLHSWVDPWHPLSVCRLIHKGSLSWYLISCHLSPSEEGVSTSGQGCAGTAGRGDDGKQEVSVHSVSVQARNSLCFNINYRINALLPLPSHRFSYKTKVIVLIKLLDKSTKKVPEWFATPQNPQPASS